MRIVYIVLGSLLVGVGGIGIFIPGLPTTPFLLLAAALYVKGSPRLHQWLTEHRLFGPLIRDYQLKRALPLKVKLFAVSMVLIMVGLSVFLFIPLLPIKILVAVLGLIGIGVVLSIPTLPADE